LPLSVSVEFSDELFMIKHNRSCLELFAAIWCFGQALPLFNVLADFTDRFVWYRSMG
jgi:hypothetical protein